MPPRTSIPRLKLTPTLTLLMHTRPAFPPLGSSRTLYSTVSRHTTLSKPTHWTAKPLHSDPATPGNPSTSPPPIHTTSTFFPQRYLPHPYLPSATTGRHMIFLQTPTPELFPGTPTVRPASSRMKPQPTISSQPVPAPPYFYLIPYTITLSLASSSFL